MPKAKFSNTIKHFIAFQRLKDMERYNKPDWYVGVDTFDVGKILAMRFCASDHLNIHIRGIIFDHPHKFFDMDAKETNWLKDTIHSLITFGDCLPRNAESRQILWNSENFWNNDEEAVRISENGRWKVRLGLFCDQSTEKQWEHVFINFLPNNTIYPLTKDDAQLFIEELLNIEVCFVCKDDFHTFEDFYENPEWIIGEHTKVKSVYDSFVSPQVPVLCISQIPGKDHLTTSIQNQYMKLNQEQIIRLELYIAETIYRSYRQQSLFSKECTATKIWTNGEKIRHGLESIINKKTKGFAELDCYDFKCKYK